MNVQPYPQNAKEHPAKQVKLIAESISKFGWQQPIVIDDKDVIVVGHGRWMAYEEYRENFNLDEVWIERNGKTISGGQRPEPLTKQEAAEYRLMDNKIAESGWNNELLHPEIEMIEKEYGTKPEEMGFSHDIILSPEEKDDAIPAQSEGGVVRSAEGDYYEFGGHRVMCGDATNFTQMELLMQGDKADMVFTDPPYNVDYQGTAGKIKNDKFKEGEFYQFLSDAISAMKPFVVGDVYIAMSSSELHTLQQAFEDNGGHWSTFIIWVKDRFTLGRSNYQRQYEPILYGWFEGSSHYWSGKRNLGDVVKENAREDTDGSKWLKMEEGGIEGDIWEIPKPDKNKQHPTMKPVDLCTRGITNSSLPGNIVLDPFLGFGSTLISAEKSGRKCYGMELDPKFVDVIIQRYVDYTGRNNINKNGEDIIW